MHKENVREQIWKELTKVAILDPRFNLDFGSYIPDFEDSEKAIIRLGEHMLYKEAECVFVTPDNCLKHLPQKILQDGKSALVASGGLRQGFYLFDPKHPNDKTRDIPSLKEIRDFGKIDLMVTGATAINKLGVRLGKGHGYFDLEWAIFYELGVIDLYTPVVVLVHDCQVTDAFVDTEVFDTPCDFIFTPTRVIKTEMQPRTATGVIWDKLEDGMIEAIPPLRELKKMQK